MCVVAHKCLHHRNVTTGLNSDDLPNKHKMHSDAKSRVRSVQTRVDFRAMVLFIDQYGPYIYIYPPNLLLANELWGHLATGTKQM